MIASEAYFRLNAEHASKLGMYCPPNYSIIKDLKILTELKYLRNKILILKTQLSELYPVADTIRNNLLFYHQPDSPIIVSRNSWLEKGNWFYEYPKKVY